MRPSCRRDRPAGLSRWTRAAVLAALFPALAPPARAADPPPSPETFLGRRVGEDRWLAPYPRVLDYFKALDAASDRVNVVTLGRSTLGLDMVMAVITSEQNHRDLYRHRETVRRLADPSGLTSDEARSLIDQGKVFVLVTCSIHATEVGSTQMSMELAHQLATARDADTLGWLDQVVLLLIPSINPDGQVIVIDWYNEHLGTEHEGGPLPWLYHPYTGHDNNRDFYMLTQKETRLVNDVLYRDWFPQVFLDEHQMGSTGPRMFVPPQTDPVDPEIDSMVLRHAGMLGTLMGFRLEQAGKTGVGDHMIFDSYWPGGTRNTAWWKNVVGLLTEVASVRIATPLYVEPGEMRGGEKGLPEHARRANYLSPWKGGWWRLRDIIDYELIATRALLEGTARHRRDLLESFHALGRKGIERGRSEPPYAFVIPGGQHDPVAAARLVELLLRHGVKVERTEAPLHAPAPQAGGLASAFAPGAYLIRAAQPYRAFLLTMLRPQRYPEVRAQVDGPILPPYDVTSWSLPLLMGVDVVELDAPADFEAARPRPIQAPEWPGGIAGGAGPGGAAGGYLLSHSADSVFTAMNRLLQQGHPVYWLRQGQDGVPAGTVWVPGDAMDPEAMERLAAGARIEARPLSSPPSGPAFRVAPARVALYKPWAASMDEGWTRWLLEQHEFPYVNVDNEAIRKGTFTRSSDVLLLPDVSRSLIAEGRPPEAERAGFVPLPERYRGGLGPEGADAIRRWVVERGGVVVALDSSTQYAIDLFELPVTNVLEKAGDRFSAPGTMVRLLMDAASPLAYGMRAEEAGYISGPLAFQTRVPDARFDRRVAASYPPHADDVLVSGYLKGADLLKGRAAVVDYKVGRGRVVLIGFRAQHRAQPHRTFKLLFNALYLRGLQEVTLP
ncbi:MAG TPA: M14 metallopeptidase family protein [Candidatus Polarisedimenticolia bacterium]|nr:M14 metallopeptidase family protein [Candidatus Polarisedimenticolia bacterium]